MFNETCCKLNGVPDGCMGNCKDVAGDSLLRSNIPRMKSYCDQFQNKIKNCMVGWKPGIPDIIQYRRLSSIYKSGINSKIVRFIPLLLSRDNWSQCSDDFKL